MNAPKAKKIHKQLEHHGDIRIDPYFWLNQKDNKEVIRYLKKENKYTDEVLSPTKQLQKKLYKEIVGRIKEDDLSVPYFKNQYWYYTRYEKGKEYPLYCRKFQSLESPEEIMLDVNVLAKGFDYYHVGGMSVSRDNTLLAYGVDQVSRRIYTIHVKNLETGATLDIQIPGTSGSFTWANDNCTLFYVLRDEQTLRSFQVNSFDISNGKVSNKFTETDDTFNVSVGKSKSGQYILIESSATLTSEYLTIHADSPLDNFEVFAGRKRGIEYDISHFEDSWLILTNWKAQNFRLMQCPLSKTQRKHWKELIAHREDTLLEGVEVFNKYMVLEERTNGLGQIKVLGTEGGEHYLSFDEETYSCWIGANPEFDSEILRFGYTSMTIPGSVFDYNMRTQERTLLKQQEIMGGYDHTAYESKRMEVVARDGKKVPVSLVYKKSKKSGPRPLVLYGYGSYGHSLDPYFSSARLSLLDRGFIWAIAHIRGGEDLGRAWYDDGKLMNKKNTFNDFIDCAEDLIKKGFTSKEHLYAMGGSAGGLLMGAVINERPDLWNGVIAAVPFVDVVTTMLDDSIPLTTGEYDEWGNPNNEEYYHYIKSYSPYDNVEAKEYPNLLVTTGLHDSQVQYWEPAKWVAKLRDLKTDKNLLLLHTNLDTGHGGASGRFEVHKETAMEYAFYLMLENIKA